MAFGYMDKDALGLRPPVQELWQLQVTHGCQQAKESIISAHLWPIDGITLHYYPPVEKC